MEYTQLLASTGDRDVDQILQSLVSSFEAAFPGRIRGYYLEGSYANQTALTTSDIDLIILFWDSFVDKSERAKDQQTVSQHNASTSLEIDVGFLDEKQIENGAPPSLKLGSTLLFGESIPNELPLVSITEWTRDRMHVSYWLMTKVFARPAGVIYPRDYPIPEAEFYGYTERTIRLADGRDVPSTRDLVRVMGWAGTALVAFFGHEIVACKKECHVLYRKHVNDEWGSLFESLYSRCREAWQYRIPDDASARDELRFICQKALAFENHFLIVYKHFVLSELRESEIPDRKHALWVQEHIPYVDHEIIDAVRELSACDEEILSQWATNALHALEDFID